MRYRFPQGCHGLRRRATHTCSTGERRLASRAAPSRASVLPQQPPCAAVPRTGKGRDPAGSPPRAAVPANLPICLSAYMPARGLWCDRVKTCGRRATGPCGPRPRLWCSCAITGGGEPCGLSRGLGRAVKERVLIRVQPALATWATIPLLTGMPLEGCGCAGRSAVECGVAAGEVKVGDSGIRTLVSVQGSLAMTAIYRHGSEEQRRTWLPSMALGEVTGCFGLTKAGAGSDPASMVVLARRAGTATGADWTSTGSKRWTGLASVARSTRIGCGCRPRRCFPGRRGCARRWRA